MKFLRLLLLLSVLSAPVLFSCEDKKKEEKAVHYNGPVMTVDNLSIAYSDSGRVTVKMSTAKQLKMQNEDEIYPKAVYINFIDKAGVEYSSLRGDSGSFSKVNNLYTLRGNVFFFNRTLQQSLATEELFWNPLTKKIYSNQKVKIKTPKDNLVAMGMEANQDFSKYSIKKPKGTFMVDSLRSEPDTTL
ncbi:LPS export ABC transporter periplasmic protein LptC [Emticicia sp. CRIBPO]|uniref:LPS export ABC transporter periplasmic protein LptC n=1 Tax=Emticicia sp. CRIBPO TaxID=2683258 RepID=UPI00141233F3|nr:LPS export ABC transporter periplasmic protein LptC [Emticicia sp. CRIBPO]NBA87952.1 LPS export ABC transporter periplasmic protein LptC [Emticicia sp. CRIBPO]